MTSRTDRLTNPTPPEYLRLVSVMERERGVEVAGRAQRGVSSWRGRERREAAGMLLPCAVRRPLLRCIILSAISLWIPAAARNKGTLLDSGRPFLFLGLAKIKKLSFPIWTSKASILFLLSLAFPLRSPAGYVTGFPSSPFSFSFLQFGTFLGFVSSCLKC